MQISHNNYIDLTHTMYPTEVVLVNNQNSHCVEYNLKGATVYGFSFAKDTSESVVTGSFSTNGHTRNVYNNEAFSIPVGEGWQFSTNTELDAYTILISRYGFIGQQNFGVRLEKEGRLSYIDGCSDSLLIYPPRKGDPSLNHLHFPSNITQTPHLHPSIRVGIVAAGYGIASTFINGEEHQQELTPGTLWYIPQMQKHRFITTNESMDVIAFHPDGDWGPEDHNHTMLNRTYISK